MIQRALIVCVGNICRSPTAEVLMRHAPGNPLAVAFV
jgi:protein-tyrosine-phosphatase